MPYYQTQRAPCINFQSSPEIEGYSEYARERKREGGREAGVMQPLKLIKGI
jgi:hypothetical protein